MSQYKILMYKTDSGKVPFAIWLDSIKDSTMKRRIRLRVDRMIDGNSVIQEILEMTCMS